MSNLKSYTMRWSVYLLAVIVTSCTTFSRENEQQSKIDSLTNELKKRDSAAKEPTEIKQELKKDTVVIEESDVAEKESEVKEIAAKKKEQKNNVPVDQKDLEREKADKIRENDVPAVVGENSGAVDERNAVLKKIFTDKPVFKSLLFGGFKDIKFNLFNNYPYRLEEVILKIHYIREGGSEIKAETRILKDVAANARMPLTAPDNPSGGKQLKVTVEAVQCRAIDLCFYSSEPANPDSHRDSDPYRCR